MEFQNPFPFYVLIGKLSSFEEYLLNGKKQCTWLPGP